MKRVNKLLDQLQTVQQQAIKPCDSSTNSFKYTMSNKMLTNEQRQFYDENGFIVIKGLLKPNEVHKYYDRFDELVANPKKGPQGMVIMRDVALTGLKKEDRKTERVVTKLQMWAYDKVLWQYVTNKAMRPYIESIIGNDLRGHHFMMINKPSDPGLLSSRHPVHQDQWYFPFAPSKYIVGVWTALQPINRNNGCLSVIPGTHKMALLPHAYPKKTEWIGPVNKAYHAIQLPDGQRINSILSKRVHLEMQPGDTVFFHPLLLHASGANLSHKNRRSISVHVCNSKLVKFMPGGVIPQQAVIAKEVVNMAKRTSGLTLTFEQIWKLKSRQMQGDPGEFAS